MKKVFYITLAVFGFVYTANAQTEDRRTELTLGAKVGANYSNVYDSNTEDFVADEKFGLAVGGFVTIPLGSLFAIQPEVLFSQKGFKGSGKLLGVNYDYTHTTNYLDVPLLLAIRPTSSISIVAGPQYSYLLSSKNDFTSDIANADQEQEFDNDNIRKNTLCLVGGLDINVSNLVLGIRAGWDTKTNDGEGGSETPRYKNMWYQATVGYRF